MLRIFERIPTPETLREGSQEETRRLQEKKEKRLRQQKEAERFQQQRQAVNNAAFYKKFLSFSSLIRIRIR